MQTQDVVFNNWIIKREIGRGSFGVVYEIERNEFGRTYKAAAKIINIPFDEAEHGKMMSENETEENVAAYYESLVEEIIGECDLLERMKGDSHIVSYEDHQVEKLQDGLQWRILIRMELLTSLQDYFKKFTPKQRDVIQLGIDICRALETCQKYNVIHRDVKLENIYVSETGNYKLGDFGVSMTLKENEIALSKTGTQSYMTPEVYHGQTYDSTVDTYALGLVLFRLLNNNRMPFLPLAPAPILCNDREQALQRRFAGEEIPKPSDARGRLGEIIQKACNFYPHRRYGSPGELRRDLEAILYSEEEETKIYPDDMDVSKKISFWNIEDENEGTISIFQNAAKKKIKRTTTNTENKNVAKSNIYKIDNWIDRKFDLRHRLVIAYNICVDVHNAHQKGLVYGCLVPENIQTTDVNGNPSTKVKIILDKSKSQMQYMPPELYQWSTEDAGKIQCNKEWDYFSLAVLVFILLMNNAHPFSSTNKDDVIKGNKVEYLIRRKEESIVPNMRKGYFPFIKGEGRETYPFDAVSFDALPDDIQDMFVRAFIEGFHNCAKRPNTGEWLNVLKRYQTKDSFQKCEKNHVYFSHVVTECPFCRAEDRKNRAIIKMEG